MMFELLNIFDWKKFTINVIIGYIISWLYFFISLPSLQSIFGKVTGSIINYSISVVVLIMVIYFLQIYNPDGELIISPLQ